MAGKGRPRKYNQRCNFSLSLEYDILKLLKHVSACRRVTMTKYIFSAIADQLEKDRSCLPNITEHEIHVPAKVTESIKKVSPIPKPQDVWLAFSRGVKV